LALKNSEKTRCEALKDNFIAIAGHFLPTDELKTLRNDLASKVTDAVFVRIISSATTKIAQKIAKEILEISLKQAGKSAGKSAGKKVPLVGLVVGGVFGVFRLFHGDIAGAVGEVASGAASCIPGFGTALSIGIDVAMLTAEIATETAAYEVRR
jgi:hypothetical protein